MHRVHSRLGISQRSLLVTKGIIRGSYVWTITLSKHRGVDVAANTR